MSVFTLRCLAGDTAIGNGVTSFFFSTCMEKLISGFCINFGMYKWNILSFQMQAVHNQLVLLFFSIKIDCILMVLRVLFSCKVQRVLLNVSCLDLIISSISCPSQYWNAFSDNYLLSHSPFYSGRRPFALLFWIYIFLISWQTANSRLPQLYEGEPGHFSSRCLSLSCGKWHVHSWWRVEWKATPFFMEDPACRCSALLLLTSCLAEVLKLQQWHSRTGPNLGMWETIKLVCLI